MLPAFSFNTTTNDLIIFLVKTLEHNKRVDKRLSFLYTRYNLINMLQRPIILKNINKCEETILTIIQLFDNMKSEENKANSYMFSRLIHSY